MNTRRRQQRHASDSNRRADQVNMAAFDVRGARHGCDAEESLESMMVKLTCSPQRAHWAGGTTTTAGGGAPVAAVPLLAQPLCAANMPWLWISNVGVIGQGVSHGVFVR